MNFKRNLLCIASMLGLLTTTSLTAGAVDGVDSKAIAPVPGSAERAQMIKSGANKGSTAWSAYIVRLDDMPLARYRGGLKGLAPTSPRATGENRLDANSPQSRAYISYLAQQHDAFLKQAESALGRSIDVMGVYRVANNGLGLWLRNDEIDTINALAGVASIEKEKLRPLKTDAGPDWIGADGIWDGSATLDAIGTEGEGIVIGVIDTGVNHDHPSFADPGPVDNYDHTNPLPEYKGLCDGSSGAPYCNDKLIGVYDCNAGGVNAGGDGSGNTPPLGPQVRALAGSGWTGSTCAVPDGPHEFADANGTSIDFTVNTANPADDVTINLYYSTDPLDTSPTQVVAYDFLFGLETTTYTPAGGIPVGYYWAEVCPYEGVEPIGPATYVGSLVWNDTAVSGGGTGDACSGGQPEDANNHGSHTASTAGGNRVNADIIAPTTTITRSLAGVAPHANIITYAGCLPEAGCLGLSLANAIEQIVIDGVDVVNYSIGGGPGDPWNDSDALGYLSARDAGIWVATSASNDGPGAGSIGSPADAPWVTTVGASTHDRVLANDVENLSGGDTPPPFTSIKGKGLTAEYPTTGTASIIYSGDTPSNADLTADPALCGGGDATAATNPWAPGTFSGEIVVCDRGTYARVDKCKNACEAGAGGCILANNAASGNSLVADGHSCPSVHISYDDGVALKAWLADGAAAGSHMGSISGAYADLQPINGDVQAGFSSRGPNSSAPNNLKPDLTNPGVDILAAVSTLRATTTGVDEYGSLSGTSMSSPHTAGAYALLKAKRPEFTPAEAQSALMMTTTRDLTRDSDGSDAGDPFDRGAGRVNLLAAARAGLVMDVTDYGTSAADAKGLNIPSFADGNCQSSCSWTRTVKSAADVPVTWTASFASEDGVNVTVTPNTFTLAPGSTQMISVTADIATADHATPQGAPGPNDENETQDLDADGIIVYNTCTANGAAGRAYDCWVFADIALTSSDSTIPNVSMPLAARSTGDFDNDGIKDLVDACPLEAVHGGDDDADGIPNGCDNCLNVANPSQCDTNGDGYGNHCDADLNNNGVINFIDLVMFKPAFNTSPGDAGWNEDADLSCNGVVNFVDLGMLRDGFLGEPGPSALVP